MKILGVIAITLLLVGCGGMSNEEIVEQTKYCKENGMDVRTVFNIWSLETTRIVCIEPRVDK